MSKLAVSGGSPLRKKPFPFYNSIGKEEVKTAEKVLKSGVLSRFLGCWHEDFYGGSQVRAFEKEWARHFGVKHAFSVNSATSGIFAAVGASGAGPGDEVIVSPYTMSASAVAPLIYNAIPVFADIEEDYFCLSPESVEKRITKRTKAIIVVDIFGLPYDAAAINAIARKHKLIVIEDCAQAPGARYAKRFAGTLGDIGIYSLNYHKHIHTGEGGVVVTDDDSLAEKISLIRNHAEAVVEAKGAASLVNMLGFNYRMTEVSAAIGREQLKKLDGLFKERVKNIDYLNKRLKEVPCIAPAKVRKACTHAYYVHPLKYNEKIAGVHRNKFVAAVKAELIPPKFKDMDIERLEAGYVEPLYLQPLYRKRAAYGRSGCPWNCSKYAVKRQYRKGLCPVTERIQDNELIIHEYMRPPMTKADLDDVADAFVKVWENRGELR